MAESVLPRTVEFLDEPDLARDDADATDPPRGRRWAAVCCGLLIAVLVCLVALTRHSADRARPRAAPPSRPAASFSACAVIPGCAAAPAVLRPLVVRVWARFPAARPVAYTVTRWVDGDLQYRRVDFAVPGASLIVQLVSRKASVPARRLHESAAGTTLVLQCGRQNFDVELRWSGRPVPRAELAALAADPGLTLSG